MRRWKTWFLIATVLADCVGLLLAWRLYAVAQRAVPVEARLHAISREGVGSKSGGGKVAAAYSYTYQGRAYQGSDMAFGAAWLGGSSSSDEEIQTVADQLARQLAQQQARQQATQPQPDNAGVAVRAWVDPQAPTASALLKRAHPVWVQAAWFGVAYLLVAAGNLLYLWKGGRK
ncbi:MAG: DUF3592 domain-containing protein [Burkholderiaceae bacterium]|nr:DUF3592 domain-containing protein [Burkholderiaceae bacterium]